VTICSCPGALTAKRSPPSAHTDRALECRCHVPCRKTSGPATRRTLEPIRPHEIALRCPSPSLAALLRATVRGATSHSAGAPARATGDGESGAPGAHDYAPPP
jgi:hypothetical protein